MGQEAISAKAIEIRVDAGQATGAMTPIWRFWGYDEPNYTYMKDGKRLLSQLAALSPATVYVRTHNLLTSGDGTPALKWGSTGIYREDAAGNPLYDWTISDRIFDTYLERGMKPYVQIGFMPEALSTRPFPYRHNWIPGGKNPLDTGWAYPPKDYKKWAELVYQWTRHCIAKYGKSEVEKWYWEVWNEPDIFYWHGTPEEYHKLYDYATDAVKRALPAARVGGPETTSPRSDHAASYLHGFLEHCLRGVNYATGKKGSPLDFISFHAKGAPTVVNGHVRMGLGAELQDIDRGFAIVASYPELRRRPIVIGECDPDGCAACPGSLYPANNYRSGTLYASYTAAAYSRIYELADKHGVNIEGAVTWAFEFENQPYFAGFRAMATNGLALPVLNVFRMFGQMGGERISVQDLSYPGVEALAQHGVRSAPDVHALASRQEGRIAVMLWNYHDDDLPGPTAPVTLTVRGLPKSVHEVLLHRYAIDERHSNVYTAWLGMGSPQNPTQEEIAALEQASDLALAVSPEWIHVENGEATLHLILPRQSVFLLTFTVAVAPKPRR